jgi:hypothetical protein
MSYYCEECCKHYKSAQSLYGHRKRCHYDIENTKNEVIEKSIKNTCKKNKEFICEYCNRNISCNFSLQRHYDTCKIKNRPDIEILELEQQTIKEFKDKVFDVISKEVDQKTFETVKNAINKVESDNVSMRDHNNVMNHSQNPVNSNNMNSNNININLVSLGNENLIDALSESEQLKILRQRCKSLETLVEHIHLNDKYPQFKSIYIDNPNRKDVHVYNEDYKNFILLDRDKVLNELIENRVNDIEDFYDENNGKLGDRTKKIVRKYLDKIAYECAKSEDSDTKYIKDVKKGIKNTIYNKRDKVKPIFKKLQLKNK